MRPTYYQILGLVSPTVDKDLTNQQVKIAYRRALLVNHPDKAKSSLPRRTIRSLKEDVKPFDQPLYTLDHIREAYEVLGDPWRRQEYDLDLASKQRFRGEPDVASGKTVTTELEEVDIDDMDHSDETGTWTHPCRCGNPIAFEVYEKDLLDEQTGEVLAYCSDCSHHVRVTFQITEIDPITDLALEKVG